MAIYHLNAKVHSRGTDPKLHALRSYAYRSGTRIVDPITGRVYNYQSKQAEVVLTETLTPRHIIVPDWMRDGPQLWQRLMTIETAVRKDAQIFREVICALPVELGIVEWATLIRGFVTEQLTDAGMVCSFSVHFRSGNKSANPHVHIMASLRGIEITGDDPDPIRFGHKNRDWNSKAMLTQWRKAWADHVNAALVKAGSDKRVTHQSFAAMGIEREATVHVGPDFKKDGGYQTKRVARIQSNEQVASRNKERGEQRRHAAHKVLMAGVCGAKLSVALQNQNEDYIQALAPVKHLIDDMAALLHQVQAVANALERPLSAGALAKRMARILDAVPQPQNQAELQTALLAMEVVFAAKRRPKTVAAVLNAVPIEQRQHFESIVASVLGTNPIDAGHDLAAQALSVFTQRELQAEFNVRQVLSQFQLSDFDCRRQAMAALGRNYTWSDFQHDIQRQSGTDSGWQRAWWDEQIDNLTGTPLASFLKTMPPWYAKSTPPKPKSYPLGSYDPHPQKTWLSALNTHLAMHPTVLASDAKDTLAPPHANDYEVDRLGAVMAPAPILEVKTCNPWGGRVNQSGGRNLRGSETPYSNGW